MDDTRTWTELVIESDSTVAITVPYTTSTCCKEVFISHSAPNGNDAMFAIEIATWLVTRFIRYARLTEHSEDCSLTIQRGKCYWDIQRCYPCRDPGTAWVDIPVPEITFMVFRYLLMDYWSAIRPEIPNVPYPTSRKICERHLSHCRM
jgi:hypothetical protein